MICDDLESCNAMPSRPNNKDQDIKDNNIKQPLNITGTIQSLENNIINLELESEEIETINLSDDIQIFKRQFDKPMKD
ncbi:MAG: hypothetical protein MCSN_1430 [Candidatus Microsyncoccus archaeolyticus]|nr:MAG: hypothetical protein MCSN_1430 [Candidatus Parcubacteria bacterium]